MRRTYRYRSWSRVVADGLVLAAGLWLIVYVLWHLVRRAPIIMEDDTGYSSPLSGDALAILIATG
ncbi:MAG: hypothetical protein ACHQ50_17040, partial [Fimbriimonadales bacterium]